MIDTKSFAFALLTCFALNCAASEQKQNVSSTKQNSKPAVTATADNKEKNKNPAKQESKDTMNELSKKLDDFLESVSDCLSEKKEIKTSICVVHDLEKLAAEKNNYIAQHILGNIYEKRDNFKLSLQWYELTLSNESLPQAYKSQVQADYERVRLKVF